MKVKIENFGPVKEFTFDTSKKFNLIVGDNNVGKSYVLNIFYFVVKTFLEMAPLNFRFYMYEEFEPDDESDLEILNEIEVITNQIKKSGSYDITKLWNLYTKNALQKTYTEIFAKKIKSSYLEQSSIVNSFASSEEAKITITLENMTLTIAGDIDNFKVVDASLRDNVVLQLSKQNRTPKVIKNTFKIYAIPTKDPDDIFENVRHKCFVAVANEILEATTGVLDIDYLPASRSGLYQALSAFGQIIAELSKSRSFLSNKIELPGISGQLSDYFIKLTNIATKGQAVEDFDAIAKSIENNILKGAIEYDFDKKRLYYKPKGTDLRLDISSTSSMVSETAPIVTYIRHIIAWDKSDAMTFLRRKRRRGRLSSDAKKILIIEEPEAHLHPNNQIKMTELYAELANLGVSIIMTSHSNYVFNKLSNSVIEGKLSPNDVHCHLFQMDEGGSTGVSLTVDEFGIDDQNFGDASEALLEERLELLQAREDCE